jgi:hypothetical protein
MKSLPSILAAPLLCAGLLAGVMAEQSRHVKAEDAEPYHARVRAAVESIPTTIGEWTLIKSEDVSAQAEKLLKPNVILSRRYADHRYKDDAHNAQLLIVQCRDSRDMVGHYPENCYVSSGEVLEEQRRQTWTVNGLTIPCVEYVFSRTYRTKVYRNSVFHFIVVPGAGIVQDMDGLNAAAEDYQERYYGAAQVQVVMSADVFDRKEREQIFRAIIGGRTKDADPAITDVLKVMLDEPKVP